MRFLQAKTQRISRRGAKTQRNILRIIIDKNIVSKVKEAINLSQRRGDAE